MLICSECNKEISNTEYVNFGGLCKECSVSIRSKKDNEYKFREVGITRHPEMYTDTEVMVEPVFTTVEEEVNMWKAAETICYILKNFSIPQSFYIWHYVNALRGMDILEELKWFEFMKFRAYYARMRNIMMAEEKSK